MSAARRGPCGGKSSRSGFRALWRKWSRRSWRKSWNGCSGAGLSHIRKKRKIAKHIHKLILYNIYCKSVYKCI